MANKKIRSKKWDLSCLIGDSTYGELLEVWEKTIRCEIKLRENCLKTLANFKKWYFAYLKALKINSKVNTICVELESSKNKSDIYQDFINEKNRIDKQLSPLFKKSKQIRLIFSENKKKILSYLKDKELKDYKPQVYARFYEDEKHIPSKENEKIIKVSDISDDVRTVIDEVNDTIRYDDVYDKNNMAVSRNSKFHDLMTSDDETIRRNTYISLHKASLDKKYIYASLLTPLIKNKDSHAQLCNYNDHFERFMWECYKLDDNQFPYIFNQTLKFAKPFKKFNQYNHYLIKEAYNLPEYRCYDYDLKIQGTKDEISIAKAKDDICNSLSPLGEGYIQYVKKFINSKHINWGVNNKSSGYCRSTADWDEGGIINFKWDGTSLQAATLSHELGHNISSLMIKDNNKVSIDSYYTLDEIPSIVNSVLTSLYYIDKMKAANAKKEYIYGIYEELITYLYEGLYLNVFRHKFIDMVQMGITSNKPYGISDIENTYINGLKTWLLLSDNEYKTIKNKSPEGYVRTEAYDLLIKFYTKEDDSFRSLSYYFGGLLGLYIGYKIYHGDKDMLNKYLKYLKVGNLNNPLKVIKDNLGINLLKPEIYTEVKQILTDLINQFIKDIKI